MYYKVFFLNLAENCILKLDENWSFQNVTGGGMGASVAEVGGWMGFFGGGGVRGGGGLEPAALWESIEKT